MFSKKITFSTKTVGFLIAAIFFVVGVLTLPHYGINWDTVNHLLRGQAYLHYFLTGKKDYSDLPPRIKYFQKENTLLLSTNIPDNNFPRRSLYQLYDYKALADLPVKIEVGHPPLSDIFSSFSNYIFFQKLGWVNDIDAYRLYGIFLASILILVIFLWVSKNYSLFAGLISCLALALYPLFFAESHFNTEKDIPQAVFYGLTIIFFWQGITKKSWQRIVLSSTFCGLALGTKFNIVFAPFIVIPWLIIYYWKEIKSFKWPFERKISLSLLFYPALPLIILFGTWPYLWSDPLGRFKETIDYYKGIGLDSHFNPQFLTVLKINTYALQWIIYTTPLIILFFSILGVIYALRKGWFEKEKTSLLILFWFLVPILRVTMPGMGIYGGVRQIMEYIPPMAVLAGIGANWLRQYVFKLAKRQLNYFLISLVFVLSFLPITLKLISIHPNQNVYFNPLIGGLRGAKEKKFPGAGNTFGNIYRQGVSWINKNVPQNARLSFAYELMSNVPTIWVRDDIDFTNLHRSGFLRQGEYVIGMRLEDNLERSHFGRYLEKFLNPVYEVKVDDISLLKVWKNDEAHTKEEYLYEEKVSNPKIEIDQDLIIIDLKKEVFLSRMELFLSERNCSLLKEGYFQISTDGETWVNMPEVLPKQWPIVVLGDQPAEGKLIYPFAAEKARFIRIKVVPSDACLKKIIKANIYELPKVKQ